MKKLVTTIALAFIVSVGVGQTPKKHVYYDTIKTVKERVDYSPDTIPVFFKQLVINGDSIVEQWTAGFVVWQTYIKGSVFASNDIVSNRSFGIYTGSSTGSFTNTPYYKDEYRFTESDIPGKFLYKNKMPVKNHVIRSLKR